jgi:hypothetical protein
LRTVTAASLLAAFAFVFPVGALGATSAGLPFPSNLLTTPDSSQITGLHVDLPKPDCSQRPSDCADVDVLNTLDGFNIQPRISIPFSGPIDPATVSSKTVFLVGPRDHVVGINQAVWEPAANTLHVESDEQLAQDSTYLLVVSKGVHAADGTPIKTTFRHDLNFGQTNDPATKAYRKALLDALPMALAGGVDPDDIATASLFTTQSITAISRKIRAQIQAATPAPATFALGPGGARTVFPAGTPIRWHRDGVLPDTPGTPVEVDLPVTALFIFPGSVASVAFGSYASPDYETAAKVIPPYGTATATPVPQGTNQVQFTLFVPGGVEPAGGWPVAIFGHGFTDSKNGAPWVVASSLGHAGIATIAINVVGHGFGAASTYTAGGVTFPAGGRGIDQNGDGHIDSTEGVNAASPQTLVGNRDGLRQTVIDIMQLVREIQVGGIDVDGDGSADLSRSRIYYAGQSFGGIYGTQLFGLEPDVRAGVANVAGGPIIEVARLGGFRPLVGLALISRIPSLYNAPPNANFTNFNENMPLRNLPIVTDTVPGASAIQELIDRTEWAQQAGNPAAYAPYITRPVIFQFARGDKTVPNPTTSAILRACGCRDRATLFRNDLAFAADPTVAKNPHTFLTNIVGPGAPFALAAQAQIATFFATEGATTIDPDGAGPIFETPTSMVPEDLAFIP